MPDDDERSRRRLGDATKSRIADLASGWSVDAPSAEPPERAPEPPKAPPAPPAPPPARSKPKTLPPPAPGSPERAALENKIVDTARTKVPSIPPPPPGAADRAKPPSIPPPPPRSTKPLTTPPKPSGPKYPRAGYDGAPPPLSTNTLEEERPFATEQRTPAVIIDGDAFAGNKLPAASGELKPKLPSKPGSPMPGRAVPIGEFESVIDTMAQVTTARRDPAEAILKIPDVETPIDDLVDDDKPPAVIESKTAPFERGDPTQNSPPDATEIQAPRTRQHTGGTLRRTSMLRRKRGFYGDVRYVFTALFGVRRARRELTELERRQDLRTTSRRRHLITAGRAAAGMDNFDHPALGPSRDTLALIEDERAKHAGAVAASDAELERVRRDRDINQKAHVGGHANADAEIAELTKKIEPLEKEASAARKKGGELRDELNRVDKKIADTEALLVSVKGDKLDKAGVQADIATLRANKNAVLRDEPTIAAQLDALNPRIAALEATRSELQKKKIELDKADQDDQRRTLELLEAIGAKRKVVERASADAEVARDKALFELGERLYVDRPAALTPQLSPIDRIDLEIGEDERRAMELREILSNIDKPKFARGLAMIILALGIAGTLVWAISSAV